MGARLFSGQQLPVMDISGEISDATARHAEASTIYHCFSATYRHHSTCDSKSNILMDDSARKTGCA